MAVYINLYSLYCIYRCGVYILSSNATCVILQQIKAYVRWNGKPPIWRDEDKGYVMKRFSFWTTEGFSEECPRGIDVLHVCRLILLSAYVSLNILVPLAIAKFAPNFYHKTSQYIIRGPTQATAVFWATAFTVAILNTLTIAAKVFLYVDDPHRMSSNGPFRQFPATKLYQDTYAAFVVGIMILLLTIATEFLIAVWIRKDSRLPIPYFVRKTCCVRSSSTLSTHLQTFALWNFFIFVQWLAMSVIPVCIVFLIDPISLVSTIGTCCCLLLFIVVAVAYLFHHCKPSQNQMNACTRWKGHTVMCVRFIGMILAFVVVMQFLFIYYLVRINSNGTARFALSLFPSVAITFIGWWIRKKVLQKNTQTNADTLIQSFGHEGRPENDLLLLDLGGTSEDELPLHPGDVENSSTLEEGDALIEIV